ncbi:MAG: helix-turn-helix transcriptional regulator [Comamonadaceae bacterium]|nr:helix-turn-helix transcriptional regulator [Comamonadaceae bacterium]
MPRPSPSYASAPPLVAFGKAVRARRLAIGVSQEALADAAEIDRSYMSSIERGLQNIGLVLAARIAVALDMSLKELVGLAKL